MKIRRTLIAIAFLSVLLAVDAGARPSCSTNRVMCGARCLYSTLGGQCDGGSTTESYYCYREAVKNDYGTIIMSCHDGTYDYCCDADYPY